MTMSMTDTKRNGNGKKTQLPPEPEPIQDPQALAVQHGIATFAKLQAERDDLHNGLTKAMQLITINKLEIEELRAQKAVAESRVASYQAERDDAVANLAIYQTLYISVMALLRTFGIENAPLVRNQQHAENKPTV